MCGICGKLNFDKGRLVTRTGLSNMLEAMKWRGPDGSGDYVSAEVGLAHRLLSIIGVGTGRQPLSNEDGTVWVTFNGEIYNYRELRASLIEKGHRFRTDTDTEVIVHLYEDYGHELVSHLRGMFAFGLWDERKKTLLMARDRVGIKPLYYHVSNRGVTFASEIKSLLADPDVSSELDAGVIDRFLTFYYLPGEDTLFRDIKKLPPGCLATVVGRKIRIESYWDLPTDVDEDVPYAEAKRRVRELLSDSVRLHMRSDVPVGVLLSGGFDSTAVLALASSESERRLSTFTVGFDAPGVVDERPYARMAAAQYGTEHHEVTITPQEFIEYLPKFVWHIEEPVCEPPAIALYHVSRYARKSVTVLLSGEGGDEVFGGYPNYRSVNWLERVKALPLGCGRGVLKAGLAMARLGGWPFGLRYRDAVESELEQYYYSRSSMPSSYFNRTAPSLYSDYGRGLMNKDRSLKVLRDTFARACKDDVVNRLLYVDMKTWLPDDLLIKADKLTMAASVELRVPLLDHHLIEYAARLPGRYKVRGMSMKRVAMDALSDVVPGAIRNRKKVGFPVPYEEWMRTAFEGWLRELLLGGNSWIREIFDRRAIVQLIEDDQKHHLYSKELFCLAILELWHRSFTSIRVPVS